MIDSLVQEAKKKIGAVLSEKHQLDDNQLDELFKICKSSLTDTMKGYVFKGKVGELVKIFTAGGPIDTNHAIVQENITKLNKEIEHKMSFSAAQASSISNTLIPEIIAFFSEKFANQGVQFLWIWGIIEYIQYLWKRLVEIMPHFISLF
ncbi:MAG: hypothetical protein IPK03_13225 [Bacteroidetes bacterium]|nr:hypothetical protein [Bacteroidota bacterium]